MGRDDGPVPLLPLALERRARPLADGEGLLAQARERAVELMTGGILIYCGGRKTLAQPLGLGYFKCSRCGHLFKGVEE